MRPIFRTIRQRGRRARAGQVSAVATVLGLLLVVSFVSNYLVFQLPGQMTQAEFAHVVQVENQLTRLQSTILAQATARGLPVNLASPVTLGSDSVPPFGSPAIGSIGPEGGGVGQTVAYQLDTVTPANPNWGLYSPCLPGGSGHCAGNGNVNYANLSGNNTAMTVQVTGGSNSLVYNINGSNDTLTVSWTGKDQGVVAIVINGSYDSVSFSKGGSDTTVPHMSFYFFGIHDTFSMSMSGSHSSKGGMYVDVRFIGSLNFTCPYDNNSATDSVGALGAGGSNLVLNVTWWNAIGYTTPVNTVAYPGGTLPSEAINWANTTGFTACPFLKIIAAQYHSTYFGGLGVHVANRWLPTADLGYEDGAVLIANPGEQALMVSGPRFYFNDTLGGVSAALTLVTLQGTLVAQAGTGTASVATRVTSVVTQTFGSGINGVFVATPYYLNITTEFPAAWMHYFEAQGDAFPFGATCKVLGPALSGGATCLTPPTGRLMEIIAPLYAQTVKVTMIQVATQIL